jgi:hypothetical protein
MIVFVMPVEAPFTRTVTATAPPVFVINVLKYKFRRVQADGAAIERLPSVVVLVAIPTP